MSINFKINDFFHPVHIVKFRSFLEKSQWFQENELKAYQLDRLKLILNHAYSNVPFYRNSFDRLKIKPSDFKNIEDIKKLPVLTKKDLKSNFKLLMAKNIKRFNPVLCKTSGTSGEPVEFYLDKYSNILEFCYYWRYWSWAGYKLGSSFAEFSIHYFLNTDISSLSHHSFITNRLILNPAQISYSSLKKYVEEIEKYRPLYLKGSPFTIYIFSLLLEKAGYKDMRFKAVFTTGELLFPYQREKIEKVFNCRILDSYGHMERTAAICQCLSGSYHVNSEYGILEFNEADKDSGYEGQGAREAIGTSLHNFAMPLIRYKIGDLIEMDLNNNRCHCGRSLPVVKKIYGRSQDAIVTRDGRFITNIFVIFNFIKGVLWYQIIQSDIKNIIVKLVPDNSFTNHEREKMLGLLSKILGHEAEVKLEIMTLGDIAPDLASKHRGVISNVKGYI